MLSQSWKDFWLPPMWIKLFLVADSHSAVHAAKWWPFSTFFVFRLFIFLQGCKRRWTTVSRLFCRVARPLTALQRPRIVARICGRILCWLRPLRWARRNLKKNKKNKRKRCVTSHNRTDVFFFFGVITDIYDRRLGPVPQRGFSSRFQWIKWKWMKMRRNFWNAEASGELLKPAPRFVFFSLFFVGSGYLSSFSAGKWWAGRRVVHLWPDESLWPTWRPFSCCFVARTLRRWRYGSQSRDFHGR